MRSLMLWILAASFLGLLVRSSAELPWWPGEGEVIRTSVWADGTPKETATFQAERRHGPCERFHPDGSIRARGQFRSGRMEGAWSFFLPDGTVDAERSGVYEDGSRVAALAPAADARVSSYRSPSE